MLAPATADGVGRRRGGFSAWDAVLKALRRHADAPPMPHHLDCRDLKCPMPIVKLAMAVRGMAVGEEVLVEATDPAFLADVRAWSRMTGNPIAREADGAVKQVVVTKAGGA